MFTSNPEDTICAVSTPPGVSAIGVIRLSGAESRHIIGKIFQARDKSFTSMNAQSHTLHFGTIASGDELIDDVLVSFFLAPHSYTGEDVVEISCHGSPYIRRRILEELVNHGARMAHTGEFTLRAFLNHKFDLSQAEAIADLIAADSKISHDLAMSQLRGGFSAEIRKLRDQLLEFASLLVLELDFSEEDVEFADRSRLMELLQQILQKVSSLKDSFSLGNVLKQGIPVTITGRPNVGKSTLLNALLNEEKALVSEIPGTTRDAIEDVLNINGVTFRFIDTAGLRRPEDTVETMGVERTWEKISKASVILYVFDISEADTSSILEDINAISEKIRNTGSRLVLIGNKTDLLIELPHHFRELVEMETIFISAKRRENVNLISESLLRSVESDKIGDTSIISNLRHYEALSKALESVTAMIQGMDEKRSTDLLTIDLHAALHHLGTITGEITTDDILGSIFSRFCIGK